MQSSQEDAYDPERFQPYHWFLGPFDFRGMPMSPMLHRSIMMRVDRFLAENPVQSVAMATPLPLPMELPE